jgi:hypothetical protein
MTEQPILYPLARSIETALGIIHVQSFCDPETDLCLEGYPACANSFLYFVFQECARHPLRIAHHTHSVANIRRALRYGVPTLVVFRDPNDAIPSYLSRFDKDPLEATLRYVRFYRQIREMEDEISLASFQEVTSHIERAVRRIAINSPLQFEVGDPNTLEERVRKRMDEQWSQQESSLFNPRDIPLPNKDRSTAKERARQAIQQLDVYAEAVREYEHIKALNSTGGTDE